MLARLEILQGPDVAREEAVILLGHYRLAIERVASSSPENLIPRHQNVIAADAEELLTVD
jgi:hypothetical protein